jgi:hypothetical protein
MRKLFIGAAGAVMAIVGLATGASAAPGFYPPDAGRSARVPIENVYYYHHHHEYHHRHWAHHHWHYY